VTIIKGPEDFQGGSNGASVTTSNSIFDQLAQGFIFSNTRVLTTGGGTLSGRLVATTSQQMVCSFTLQGIFYVSFYIYVEANPSANFSLAQIRDSSGAIRAELRINSTGAFALRNSSQTAIYTSATQTHGQWMRVNWKYDNTNAKQRLLLYIGSNVHGTTADVDSGDVTTTAAGTADRFAIGTVSAATVTVNLDNIVVDNSAFAAPTGAPSNTPPTANAGADQANVEPGTLITLTGTDSDSDGTVTSRSWSQVGGSPTVTLSGTGQNRTFVAPATTAGTTLTFRYSATDNSGATTTDDMTVTVLQASDFIMQSGVWVPAYWEKI
jgi:hypothetical protein